MAEKAVAIADDELMRLRAKLDRIAKKKAMPEITHQSSYWGDRREMLRQQAARILAKREKKDAA